MSISMLEDRPRLVPGSGPWRTRDGAEFDKARLPYAYRHTYAQRHADAGCPSTCWPSSLITAT